MIKKILVATILSIGLLFIVGTVNSYEPYVYKPLPTEEFKALTIPKLSFIPDSPSFVPSPSPTPTPEPTAKPTPKPTKKPALQESDKAGILKRGKATTYGNGYAGFLALPEGPGIRVEICALRCITRVSNDAGPAKSAQREGKIVDLNEADFNYICKCNWEIVGVIKNVTVEYLN